MKVRVLFFAAMTDLAGVRERVLDLPEGATAGDLIALLSADLPALADRRGSLMLAVNRTYASAATVLSDGDEVALIPPVSGG
ncbi:MAG: Molybdopterin synthase sulfur carrier subunit [Phycisphaerae bacterium]|nr:Molybdopterin synthase sulfur carrier subunit [Phycisphaerae bacterium]